MNIDEHFDRASKQNPEFQFEFVYCAPLGKPVLAVAGMSTDDASKLKSSCSRSCLGRVWSYLRDVSVLVLCCLGDVSGCHGDVSVLFS